MGVAENVDNVIAYQPQNAPVKHRRATALLLIAITLFGGVLRFWKISQPPLWGDEAATFSRICGSYQDLLDILQFNGFVPLHYELYQWIAGGMPIGARIEHRPVEPVVTRRSMFFRSKATPAGDNSAHDQAGSHRRTSACRRRDSHDAAGHAASCLRWPARWRSRRSISWRARSSLAALIAAIFTATSRTCSSIPRRQDVYALLALLHAERGVSFVVAARADALVLAGMGRGERRDVRAACAGGDSPWC